MNDGGSVLSGSHVASNDNFDARALGGYFSDDLADLNAQMTELAADNWKMWANLFKLLLTLEEMERAPVRARRAAQDF